MRIEQAPRAVRVAGLLVIAQGVAGIAFAVALLVRALGGAGGPGNVVAGGVIYFALLGGAVALAGAGLLTGRRAARTPSVVVQLLLLGVAWYAFGPSDRPAVGIAVAAVCVVVLILLFTAGARNWTMGERADQQRR